MLDIFVTVTNGDRRKETKKRLSRTREKKLIWRKDVEMSIGTNVY